MRATFRLPCYARCYNQQARLLLTFQLQEGVGGGGGGGRSRDVWGDTLILITPFCLSVPLPPPPTHASTRCAVPRGD